MSKKPRADSSESEETAKDIDALQAISRSRLTFNLRVCDASRDKSEPVLSQLRSEATYQIAEFLFLLRGFGIKSQADFDKMIERHNDYVSALLADGDKMRRMGLTSERLLNAIFDGETRPRVLHIWSDHPGSVDQSSLGRFLVSLMSDETARKTIVACGKAGFVERETSHLYRLVLVHSNGTLEDIYSECLRDVRKAIQSLK